jgi:hypothetical protein
LNYKRHNYMDVNNNDQLTEKIAEAVHGIFLDKMKSLGYSYGPVTDEKKKQHSSLLPYQQLPEDEKEQNRSNGRDIQNKLESIGYKIVTMKKDLPQVVLTGEQVEKLSRREHQRWMDLKLKQGWKYAPETDKQHKLHKWIIPYEKLPEEEKDKDRVLVKAIPEILAKAGLTIASK